VDRLLSVFPVKPTITKEELEKVDIRVGTIEAAEEIPGSGKLVKLTVDFGDHKRTILSGIKKERPNFKELEGKQTLFVINLEPRQMMGLTSEGMLYDIGFADGIKPIFAVPETPAPNGSRTG
jgi:tRNA-binding protein